VIQRRFAHKEIMPAKPKTIDDYLARVSATQRAALEKLRRDIKAAALRRTIAPFIPVLIPSGHTRTGLRDMILLKAQFDFPPKNRFQPDW
jgi:hypothetical protein